MEHIVQIGIGIDDDSIIKNVSAHAEETITKQLLADVKRVIFETDVWSGKTNENFASDYVIRRLDLFMAQNRDEIINVAGKHLAEKLCRTKKAKELLDNLSETEVSSE